MHVVGFFCRLFFPVWTIMIWTCDDNSNYRNTMTILNNFLICISQWCLSWRRSPRKSLSVRVFLVWCIDSRSSVKSEREWVKFHLFAVLYTFGIHCVVFFVLVILITSSRRRVRSGLIRSIRRGWGWGEGEGEGGLWEIRSLVSNSTCTWTE